MTWLKVPAAALAALSKPGGFHWARRWSSSAGAGPLWFCIVGSGPAGFYTADKLLKKYGDQASVDIVEALPTPFGLVRSGVAPDHADTKNVINQFTALAGADPRLSFLGNVRVGRDVSLQELRQRYSAVVLCYGAESDRKLGVPGEDLQGVFSAREFVWWYNGHPHYATLPIDLARTRRVAICGLGNVAVDCARVLLQPPRPGLAATDIASHAVAALERSGVKEVHLIGRRGPAQAAFTPKELRELLSLEGVGVRMDPAAFALSPADEAELKATRMRKRVFDILDKSLKEGKSSAKTLCLDFLRNPAEVVGDGQGRVAGLKLEKTRVEPSPSGGAQQAVGTGEYETIEVDMVLKSIGFKSVGIPGVAFDAKRGVIPNSNGQVLREDGSQDPGLFVCGWLKRGPSGIIGTNLIDAEQTVETIGQSEAGFQSVADGLTPGRQGLMELMQQRGTQVVTFQDWLKIDKVEVERGQAQGKPREKVVSVDEMLQIAAS